MFEVEIYKRFNLPSIQIELKKLIIVKRYFCKRGKYLLNYNWLELYKVISDFKLIFKFKYNLINKTINADYVPKPFRWQNNMRFFKFYLKLFTKFKWTQLQLKQIIQFLNKTKRSCYLGLVSNK